MNKKFLLKNFLLLPMLLFVAFISNAQTLTESFDNVTFPPAGWVNNQIGGGTDVWIRATSTTETVPDNIPPHSGSGMALYDAYNILDGNSADLGTPALDFTGGPHRVKFWMYRDSRYSIYNDSMEVFVNSSSATSVGGTKLGVIYRHYLDAPIEATTGWYQYSFDVPASFVGASNYIVFRANSDYGTEMVIDDVVIELQPLGCSGTPSAGTISGPASACSATNFTLTAVGATEGQGMSYQWQSAPAVGGPWTNIAGQTSFNLASVSQTALTYYRLVATCTNGGTSANSNVVSVGLKSLTECYCQPPSTILHSFVNDFITNFNISGTTLNSSNATNASTGYTLVPPTPANNTGDLQKLSSYTLTATLTDFPGGQVGAWIDLNQNGTFEGSEYIDLVVSADLLTATASIQVSGSAVEGLTGLRLRARTVSFLTTGSCSSFGSGETEDYTVNITAPGAVINGAIVDIIPPASASCNSGSEVVVKLRNSGSLNIEADAATVALYVTGANPQGPILLTNNATILPGDTATLTFIANFPVDGTNIDSVFIQSLVGDNFPADDSLLTAHITLPAPVAAPTSEDFEADVAGWTISQIAGSGNWSLASGVSYPGFTPPYTLAPKSGTTVALFDSYTFASGTIARLNSNCISLPVNANADCGYIVGFYMAQDPQYNFLDSIVVRITSDGGNTYTRLGKVQRLDSTLSTTNALAVYSTPEWRLYTFDVANYAGQTVQFALDAYSLYGNPIAIDSFFVGPKTIGGNVALANGPENGRTLSPALNSCTDADGYTYYTDGNSARYLFGVNWGNNAAAKTQATAKLTVDRKWFIAEDVANLKATYTMQRYWNVNLNGATISTPVSVRFFYTQRELDSIIQAKDDFLANNPGSNDEGLVWFKTVSGDFVPTVNSVTPDGVVSAIPLTNTNTTGATINGVLYAQFDGITSFSGGTAATGVGLGTPLPVTLLSFNATRTGKVNKITWSTVREINANSFVVERSLDGRNFTEIGRVAASGNSTSTLDYSFIDNTPVRGFNYYRLRLVDRDNSARYSTVKNVRNEGSADVAIYPNPVNNAMQLNIAADKSDRATVQIFDLSGKMVYSQASSINEGLNYFNINTSKLNNGAYVIKVQLTDDVIVKKFNKL